MKKNMIRFFALLLAMMLGCGFAMAEDKITIGFSHCNLSISWMADLQTLVEKKAEELGVELILANANNNTSKQIADVENLLMQGVDGILMDAVDSSAAVAVVETIAAQGVPVASTDRAIPSDKIVTFATGDNRAAGREVGKFCAETLGGKGKVVLLLGPLGLDPVIQRSEGFKEIIAEYPDIEIVSEQVANNDRATAVSVMENILTATPEIDFVFATNDEMVLGAINAMKAANRLEGVKTATVGGHAESFTSILNGEMTACIYYPSSMGAVALENLVAHIKGEEVENKVVVESACVTIDNAAEFLASVQ